MDSDARLGEAGGLAYRSAGSGRPLVLLHPTLDRCRPVVARRLEETKP